MATGINLSYITPYSSGIINVINNILVPVLIAVAFIVFLWGVYKYFIWGAENETEKTEGRKFAMWGVIGFVIILSLWGIVNLVMGTFGLSVGKAPPFPTIGGSAQTGSSSICPVGQMPSTSGGCVTDPSAQYGSGGTCPTGYVPDDNTYSGCAPASSRSTGDIPDNLFVPGISI